jgi:hypothetical protein
MVKCGFKDCPVKKALFGFENDKPKFCSKHKENGMIDLYNSKCFCKKSRPTFGLEGTKATHCNECKTEIMIDVVNPKCFCKKSRPSYGLKGTKATHCNECKTEIMIDVVNPKCFCKKSRPSYGLEGTKATHCSECKTEFMIDIVHNKCFCKKHIPCFGLKGDKPTHCNECKEKNMINVVDKRCKSEFCDTQVKNKFEGFCYYCFVNLNPDSPLVRNFKTKERLVVDYIKDQYKDYDWKFDKAISDGCSNRRPDIYIDLGYQILIIEVDENQHRYYEDICENKRMMTLSQDVNHRPIVFIRFNPDKYINKENKSVPSCFSITKATGVLKVSMSQKWKERLKILKENVDYWINKKTNKTLELVQLFYDEEI